jgi:tetratricopeptide (TPR) repeat protein
VDDRLRNLLTLGKEHYASREYEQAEKYLTEVLSMHRGFADVFNMLGVIQHDHGHFRQAQEYFEEALRINPNYTEAALNLAVTYNDLGKYDAAKIVYSRAIQRSRQSPQKLDPFALGKLANMHDATGNAYVGCGLYEEAIREFRRALELRPTFVDIRTRLAKALRDSGDVAGALKELEEVKRTNPHYVSGRIHLGIAYYSAGRREDAARELEDVIAIDPGNKNAAVYLRMVKDDSVHSMPASAEPTIDVEIVDPRDK